MKVATLCSAALLAGAIVLAMAQEAPPSGRPKAPAKPTPPAPAAPTSKVHFEPAKLDHTDVAVGETVTDHLTLVADEPTNWDKLRLVTQCDCVTAEFVGEPRPLRAEVLVTVVGVQVEDVEPDVLLQPLDHKTDLASARVNVKITRKPFVTPRELKLDAKSADRFELVIGQAFEKTTEKTPDSLLVDLNTSKLDQKKIDLLDMGTDEHETTEKDVIVRTKLTFFVQKDARGAPFDTEIPVEFGQPPVKKAVLVHWPATKK
jgi:hypothetical protein